MIIIVINADMEVLSISFACLSSCPMPNFIVLFDPTEQDAKLRAAECLTNFNDVDFEDSSLSSLCLGCKCFACFAASESFDLFKAKPFATKCIIINSLQTNY